MNKDIAVCARCWIGTRFHHQGRLKKSDTHNGGVDCLGLLIGVANELNLPLAGYDEIGYSHYPDVVKLKNRLQAALQEIPIEVITEGDILLLAVEGNPQHLAIVGKCQGSLSIIHAYAQARQVVEHLLDSWWYQRIIAAYRVCER